MDPYISIFFHYTATTISTSTATSKYTNTSLLNLKFSSPIHNRPVLEFATVEFSRPVVVAIEAALDTFREAIGSYYLAEGGTDVAARA
jgi:hypothetical protein